MALIKSMNGKTPDVSQAAFVAENATIIGDVQLGKNSSIWYGAVLRGDSNSIVIGEGTNIQDCAVLHTAPWHALAIGRNVTIGHSAIVHGCTVGDGVLIGMHATILNGANVGAGAIVAAGALITENAEIPAKTVAMGVPAKVRGEVSAELAAANLENNAEYVREAAAHAYIKPE